MPLSAYLPRPQSNPTPSTLFFSPLAGRLPWKSFIGVCNATPNPRAGDARVTDEVLGRAGVVDETSFLVAIVVLVIVEVFVCFDSTDTL